MAGGLRPLPGMPRTSPAPPPFAGEGMKMESILNAALEYAKIGFSVIPCRQDKKPLLKWEQFQKRRADEKEIRGWFTRWPAANVGIVTGAISGLCVVDIDEPEGHEALSEFIPDSLLMPSVETPRGGRHLYFRFPSEPIGNNARVIPGCDFRGEGGYVVAPPSQNGNGKSYSWLPGLSLRELDPPALPDAYINIILNSSLYMRSGLSKNHTGPQKTTETTEMFIQGRRDEDIFHLANILVKGGATEDEMLEVLKRVAKTCDPPFPENEISVKIQSATKRLEVRERNLTQEIREWVKTTEDHIKTTQCHKELQMTTKREFKTCTMSLRRLCDEGILVKDGHGGYRKVDNVAEPVDFLHAPTEEFSVTWPLGIHHLSVLYPGNIVIVAGSKSAGKTAFLLNTARLNQNQHEVIFLNSEMGDAEFRKRLELFEGMSLPSWKLKAFHRNSNFADLITGEKKIFIVDFLEVTSDFWKVAQYIQDVHKKLKEGIAIIALQKSDMRDAGRGGDFSKEKSRLYLALDYLPEKRANRIKIVDAKAWKSNQNPRGMFRFYKLVNGAKFIPDGEWRE